MTVLLNLASLFSSFLSVHIWLLLILTWDSNLLFISFFFFPVIFFPPLLSCSHSPPAVALRWTTMQVDSTSGFGSRNVTHRLNLVRDLTDKGKVWLPKTTSSLRIGLAWFPIWRPQSKIILYLLLCVQDKDPIRQQQLGTQDYCFLLIFFIVLR